MTKLLYRTKLTPFEKDEKPAYSANVIHNGTVGEETFFKKVSSTCGMNYVVTKAIFDLCVAQLKEELRNGNRVELPNLSAFLTLPGNFASISPESRQAADAKLVAHIVAKGAFKTCCAGEEFELVNVTKGATVVIRGVSDMISKQENVLTNGTGVEVHVVGSGLYIPDEADEMTGVWIENKDGIVCAMARVTESTSGTLVCVFGEIALEEGAYKLCVASRNGLNPEQYGVTVARRNVTVVNATEEEGV